jgi:protein translocase SecG subunit
MSNTILNIIVFLLTAVLVVDSFFLILLVLVQLPKKEAGAGLAFGGGASDAIFGAGGGNALTKITKYAVFIFFALSLSLSVLHSHMIEAKHDAFKEAVQAQAAKTKPAPNPVGLQQNFLKSEGTLTNAAATDTNKASAPINLQMTAPAKPAPGQGPTNKTATPVVKPAVAATNAASTKK